MIPVLLHDQFDADKGLELHFGIILHKSDVQGHTRYKGKIAAVVSRDNCAATYGIRVVTNLEHYDNRTSACWWVYLDEIEKAWQRFTEGWDAKEKTERLKKLLETTGLSVLA